MFGSGVAAKRYREMKAYFVDIATHRSIEALASELYNVPFEPYAPVRQQMLNILRLINRARKAAGYDLVPSTVLRYLRRITKPFHSATERGNLPASPSLECASLPGSGMDSETSVALGEE